MEMAGERSLGGTGYGDVETSLTSRNICSYIHGNSIPDGVIRIFH